jgi:enolase
MKPLIKSIKAMEILDSRGNPTIRVHLALTDGIMVSASVPSGASTGENEALELRDGNPSRYCGKGVLKAAAAVNDKIAPKLTGMDPVNQRSIDRIMIELDGTDNKSALGANAILGVSIAAAKAGAGACRLPLYEYLGGAGAHVMPVPMMNIVNGGKHAQNNLDLQEFMIMPIGFATFREALRAASEVFHHLQKILDDKGCSTAVGDEGGFAPNLRDNEEACELIIQAIEQAGYATDQIRIALDPAASSFYTDGNYVLGKSSLSVEQLMEFWRQWVERFPIVSIEDPFDENDWDGFARMTAAMGNRIQIVGDDLLVTNSKFIHKSIAKQAVNAVLIKPNQIGTLSEAMDAINLCRSEGWGYIISHRSGETEDPFIADFAVAMGGGQIKTGSLTRSERLAKYNRLLEIEQQLGAAALYSASDRPLI